MAGNERMNDRRREWCLSITLGSIERNPLPPPLEISLQDRFVVSEFPDNLFHCSFKQPLHFFTSAFFSFSRWRNLRNDKSLTVSWTCLVFCFPIFFYAYTILAILFFKVFLNGFLCSKETVLIWISQSTKICWALSICSKMFSPLKL